MKRAHVPAGWVVAASLLLVWSAGARADEASCRAAMSKAHEGYLIAVSKAKAKEARGHLPGRHPVRPEVTAGKMERARLKAVQLMQTGCAGVASPSDADPQQCPGLDLEDCLTDIVNGSNAIVEAMQAALLPSGPVCLGAPSCDPDSGLPLCDPANQCFCHGTAEGTVDCVDGFSCATAPPCVSSSECPPGRACYLDTCCGPGGVCGPTTCQPGGPGTATGGLSATVE